MKVECQHQSQQTVLKREKQSRKIAENNDKDKVVSSEQWTQDFF